MEDPTKNELIKESHKKLGNYYYEWFLLLSYYRDKLYQTVKLSPSDKRKLERNPEYGQELLKRNISEDWTTDHKDEYRESKEDADYVFEVLSNQVYKEQLLTDEGEVDSKEVHDFKAFIRSIGKEKNSVIGPLIEFEKGEREDLDPDHGFSFEESAREHRILSIIYHNYEEVVKIMDKFVNANIYHLIESYKDVVTRDSSELIQKWSEKIKRIKTSRIGGRQKVEKKGFILAIQEVLRIKGNDFSRENIWRYFAKNHSIKPLDIEGYEIKFAPDITGNEEDDLLIQNYDGIKRTIKKGTFFNYITKIRPKRKK